MRASRAVSLANQILHVHFKSKSLEVTISSPSLFCIGYFEWRVLSTVLFKNEEDEQRINLPFFSIYITCI